MGDFADMVTDATDAIGAPLGYGESEGEKQASKSYELFRDLEGKLPNLKKLKLDTNLARYIESLSPTELKQIQENPQLLDAQMGALNKLGDITAGGGLSAADRGRIGQIGREEAIAERGQRQALMQNAQARGLGGSGLEMASLLGAQQGTANRQANRDIDVENLAQNRALQAINAQGALSGQIRGQNYEQAANAARAQDIINQFNVQGKNDARLAGANLRNQQTLYNTQQLPQQRYENLFNVRQAQAGARQQIGQAGQQRQQRPADFITAYLGGK